MFLRGLAKKLAGSEQTMKRISAAELEHLHSVGEGLIYNDYSGKGSPAVTWNVLHAAYCNWVLQMVSNADLP